MTKARDLANVISGSGTLNANVIPNLPTSKITSGTFADARLSSSSVTQHVDLTALSASNLTSGTVPDARLSASSVTQHVDLSNLNASNLTSGTVPNARYGTPTFSASNLTALNASQLSSGSIPDSLFSTIPASAVTQHVSAVNVNVGSWSPSSTNFSITVYNADYVRVGRLVHVTAYYKVTGYTNTGNKAYMTGLPYTSAGAGDPVGTGYVNGSDLHNFSYGCFVHGNSTAIYFRGGDGRKSLSHADYKGTLRGSDFQYLSTGYRGNDDAFHNFTLTYISSS